MSYISSPSPMYPILLDTIKLRAVVTAAVLLVRLLFYLCLRNFNNWNSKWTNMLISVFSLYFIHMYLSVAEPAGLVFLFIYERLYPGALYPLQPLVYYFFTAYPLISSRSWQLFALCISSTPSTPCLRFSLSVFSPRYKFSSPPGDAVSK